MVCGCSKNAESCGCSTMNAENDIHTDLIISIDTSASTGYLNVNQKYRKVAMKSIKDLNPTNVIIFDHNGTVEKVFEGSADDGFAFLRMDSDTLQPRNGTARMDDVLNAIMGLRGNKLILTDLTETRKNAEEPTVQEPDFLPNGDGRIIGQQDFAMNLTPLHAESEDESCSVCDGDVDTEEDIGRYTRCESCHKPFHNQTVCGFEGGIHTCVKCLNILNSDKPHLLEDFEIEHLNEYNKSRKNAESFNAERGERMNNNRPCRCNVCDKYIRKGDEMYDNEGYDLYCRKCFKEQGIDKGFNAESKCGCGCSIGNCQCPKGCKCGCGDHKAESRFDKLSNEIAEEYEEKGMSPEKAQEVGDATAAKVGRAKYGKKGMRNMQKKGMKADMVGSPSPTFNEDITGQDGPSASPTNQTFEAMRTMAPSSSDVNSARRMLKNQGYGEVIYDRYLVNQQGSSNKFYYTAITEKDGKYFPMGAYGRIGYLARLFNVAGKTERPTASFGTMEQAYRHLREKEQSKVNARKSEKQYIDYTLKSAETLAEIEGPTAEATAGGLHSPSSFDMTWEDGSGQSSASIPPNEIAWAENTGFPTWAKLGAGIAVLYGVGKVITSKMSEQKAENTLLSAVKARKGCCGGKSAETVRKNSEYSVGQINPVEVEGQSDVHGAEEVQLSKPHQGPQSTHYSNERPSQKMW